MRSYLSLCVGVLAAVVLIAAGAQADVPWSLRSTMESRTGIASRVCACLIPQVATSISPVPMG